MEFLKTIKDKATETAMGAVAKTNEMVETTKMKFAINEAESAIERIMKEIGIVVYEEHKNGVEFTGAVGEKCAAIDEKNLEITELRNQINLVRNIKACESCKCEVGATDNFCPKCGAQIQG